MFSSVRFKTNGWLQVMLAVSWIVFHVSCHGPLPYGSGQLMHFTKHQSKFIVDESQSFGVHTLMVCSRRCNKDPRCSVFHHNEINSACITDVLSIDVLIMDPLSEGSNWTTYFRQKLYCEENWTQLDDSCYRVSSDDNTWENCRSYCEAQSSHLATVQSDREMEFVLDIRSTLTPTNIYIHIGGEQNPDNTWRWVTGERWHYTRWAPGEPNSENEKCLTVYPLSWGDYWAGWNDMPCYGWGYCLCEKPLQFIHI